MHLDLQTHKAGECGFCGSVKVKTDSAKAVQAACPASLDGHAYLTTLKPHAFAHAPMQASAVLRAAADCGHLLGPAGAALLGPATSRLDPPPPLDGRGDGVEGGAEGGPGLELVPDTQNANVVPAEMPAKGSGSGHGPGPGVKEGTAGAGKGWVVAAVKAALRLASGSDPMLVGLATSALASHWGG